MSILNTVRAWRTGRRQRKQDAYAESRGYATPEEAENLDESKKLTRNRFKLFGTGGMPDGKGISPTGSPIDFTADEKPPRY